MEPKYGMRAIIRGGFFSGTEGTLVNFDDRLGYLVELSPSISTWQPRGNLNLGMLPGEILALAPAVAEEST